MTDTASPLAQVSLDDKYEQNEGALYLTGIQALIRLLLLQQRRDRLEGLNTAGFVSGYRGSPLGGLDFGLWQAKRHLEEADILFQPGLNEDLAATMIWGSQQTNLLGGAKFDGVFGMWYGKNPGLDRCGDVFKHANMAGISANGGVLAVSGDDPAASSSSIPNQCEQAFMTASMPVLYPANVAEILEMGLMGYAASRYSGLWIGMKTVADTLETTSTVDAGPIDMPITRPNDFTFPPEGIAARWPDDRLDQDPRLQQVKLPAVEAFARANRIDHCVIDAPSRRFGIVAAGKAYLDLRQALTDLGIDDDIAAEIGLAVYKVGMVWPLESEGATEFASGLEELFVIEERRPVLETQFKELAYHWPADSRPRIIGKTDEAGAPLIPSVGETSPGMLARLIGRRLAAATGHSAITAALEKLDARDRQPAAQTATTPRIPYYCSGCPHARSTRLPEGSRAFTGIGCHGLAMWIPGSNTVTMCHMGGEGASWIGAAPFLEDDHVFQNMGDGTYFHSGVLAIRAAVAAKARITYKILYNNAVAMTGGQPLEGSPDPTAIAWQVHSEGAGKIFLVAADTSIYGLGRKLPPGVSVHERHEMDALMKECRSFPGVSIIIYDQLCATEKRRIHKRSGILGTEDRLFINEKVCEGCGDCSVKSACSAVLKKDTELGSKREINQSTCNTDFSCLDGFCPSFVTVSGGALRKAAAKEGVSLPDNIPEPAQAMVEDAHDIIIAGVGGTGLITIGALIGMAAHLEGLQSSILDNTGLARKGGGVTSHVRVAPEGVDLHASRISEGNVRLVIGGDMLVTAGQDVISRITKGATKAVVNSHTIPTSAQALNPDTPLEPEEFNSIIREAFEADDLVMTNVTTTAAVLMGDSIFANIMLLGMAYQIGAVPLSLAALERAIEINGIAVEANKAAFTWGRMLSHDATAVRAAVGGSVEPTAESDLGERVSMRKSFLTDYQNAALATRYAGLVTRTAEAESELPGATGVLSETVAEGYFKLLAYKDEYEVARLMSHPDFMAAVRRAFDGDITLTFHLAPPFLPDADTGNGKRSYGPWMMKTFKVLAGLKGLRGTPFDLFGYQAERRLERRLIADYERDITALLAKLSPETLDKGVELAGLPLDIKGFGAVKGRALEAADVRRRALLADLNLES